MQKRVMFGLAAMVAATSIVWSAAGAGVTIETGDVEALFEAMKSAKTPIDLKPGTYDLTKLTPKTPKEAGVTGNADDRTAYLLTSSGIELRGNTTKHWSEWTDDEKVVLKGNGTQRLVYPYGGGGRGAKFYGIVFEDGSATNSPTGQDGGAIYFMGNSGGFATNCVFRNCSAKSGGGAYCVSSKDCLFENCMATSQGGGVYLNGENAYSAPTNFLSGCVFRNCSANAGGAVFANELSAFGTTRAGYIADCTFMTNSASSHGGAICENKAGLIRNCRFEGNEAADGGAVRAYSLFSCMLSNCTFVANRTKTGKGGAVDYWQNVVACSFSDNVAATDGGAVSDVKVLTDCGFTNNVSKAKGGGTDFDHGGGALFGSAAVTNCTFSGNEAYCRGGAVYGSGTYTNCLFVGNCSTNDGGASYTGTYRACLFTNNWTVSSSGHGGANAWGTLYGCRVVGNRALNHRGGGIFRSTAHDTSFCDNTTAQSARGGAAAFSKCYDCFFTGIGEVSCGTYVGCEFSGVEAFQAQTWIFDSVQNGGENTYVTNCLVHHCKVPQLISNNGKRMEVVNCTFADNTLTKSGGLNPFAVATYRGVEYSSPTKYHVSTSVVVNCLFVNNTADGARVDLGVFAEAKETFEGSLCVNIVSNCMYESGCTWAGGQVGKETCFQGSARFVAGNADYPDEPYYALRHASAARNRGINQSWMTSAKDFAGRDRILEGVVDVGCYECDLPAIGLMLLLR